MEGGNDSHVFDSIHGALTTVKALLQGLQWLKVSGIVPTSNEHNNLMITSCGEMNLLYKCMLKKKKTCLEMNVLSL